MSLFQNLDVVKYAGYTVIINMENGEVLDCYRLPQKPKNIPNNIKTTQITLPELRPINIINVYNNTAPSIHEQSDSYYF